MNSATNAHYFRANNTSHAHLQRHHLTAREQDVLALLACGLQNKEIAKVLGIAPNTVAGYLKDIYRKLNVNNRTAASAIAFELGLLKGAQASADQQLAS